MPFTFEIPKEFPKKAIAPAVFVGTALLCLILSIWTASAIERFSRLGVRRALQDAGHSWAQVDADGLQVIISGQAPTEAMRFRALTVAAGVVDSTRVIDQMSVTDSAQITAPDFSIEILRNEDGISLIGLAPTSMDRDTLLQALQTVAGDAPVTDMLETADHPAPNGWDAAVKFAEGALKLLPRSKISLAKGRIAVTAISDSPAQKTDIEGRLKRIAPSGMPLVLDISAPRPVIAPFTLRFLKDKDGARFDACSADSDKAAAKIVKAAIEVGADADTSCTVGLGVPTPDWAKAVAMGLKAVGELGEGSITFSDADIALIAGASVDQGTFDNVVGDLESNLPEVFSLKAAIADTKGDAGAGNAEFIATLSPKGKVDMTGRLGDDVTRQAVESYAAARFGADAVHAATRLDAAMPSGWPTRVLVGLEVLSQLEQGKVIVHAGSLRIEGVSGSKATASTVSRILTSKLGANGAYDIAIRYDEGLDPQAAMPTDEECVARIGDAIAAQKISFEPGKAVIAPQSLPTIDKIAEILKVCPDTRMEVGGHTDGQGGEDGNLRLSQQRADAVIAALQARKVLTGNLTAKGYGESQPLVDDSSDANRERNRRIEFHLLTGSAPTIESAATGAVVQTPDKSTPRPKKKPAH